MKYKITISEITETEVPETEYQNTHRKNEEGEDVWEYQETGDTEIKRKEKNVYEQEIDDLDIGELAIFINRAK